MWGHIRRIMKKNKIQKPKYLHYIGLTSWKSVNSRPESDQQCLEGCLCVCRDLTEWLTLVSICLYTENHQKRKAKDNDQDPQRQQGRVDLGEFEVTTLTANLGHLWKITNFLLLRNRQH